MSSRSHPVTHRVAVGLLVTGGGTSTGCCGTSGTFKGPLSLLLAGGVVNVSALLEELLIEEATSSSESGGSSGRREGVKGPIGTNPGGS